MAQKKKLRKKLIESLTVEFKKVQKSPKKFKKVFLQFSLKLQAKIVKKLF